MAVAVMIYHYTAWSIGSDAGSLLSKLGLYAVAIFYILSGLSLTLAYRERLGGNGAIARYSVRRLFRIAPLFWLATTGAIAIGAASALIRGAAFDLPAWKVFANYSLTFGFFAPDA